MRRFLALVLLAVFGLPVVAPALSLGQDVDSHLPACCRRNGAHHCAMSMGMAPGNAPALTSRCPCFPQPSTVAPHESNAALILSPAPSAAFLATLATPQAAETQRRIARERSRYKRGPPSVRLSWLSLS